MTEPIYVIKGQHDKRATEYNWRY